MVQRHKGKHMRFAAALLTGALLLSAVPVHAGERIEGDGFDTPREAVSAYIQGLIDNDISEMLSACAVESYVDHYSLEADVERMKAAPAGVMYSSYLPDISDFSREINIETRRFSLVHRMKFQYLMLIQAKVVMDSEVTGKTVPLEDGETAAELLEDIYADDDTDVMSGITFQGLFIPPLFFFDNYYQLQLRKVIYRQTLVDGAEEERSLAAVLDCSGTPYLLVIGVIRYNGKWYVAPAASTLASLMGLNVYTGGMLPLVDTSEAEELAGEGSIREWHGIIDLLSSNPEALAAVERVCEEAESIDIEAILSLPEDEQSDAYDTEFERITSSLTEQEMTYFKELLDRD